MNPMSRMIVATVVLIVSIAGGWFAYSMMVLPLEYTTDALVDIDMDDVNEVDPILKNLPYFFAGAYIVFVILIFIWFLAVAHKYEYERE